MVAERDQQIGAVPVHAVGRGRERDDGRHRPVGEHHLAQAQVAAVDGVQVPQAVERDRLGLVEARRAGDRVDVAHRAGHAAHRGHRAAPEVHAADGVVVGVGDVQDSACVERQPFRLAKARGDADVVGGAVHAVDAGDGGDLIGGQIDLANGVVLGVADVDQARCRRHPARTVEGGLRTGAVDAADAAERTGQRAHRHARRIDRANGRAVRQEQLRPVAGHGPGIGEVRRGPHAVHPTGAARLTGDQIERRQVGRRAHAGAGRRLGPIAAGGQPEQRRQRCETTHPSSIRYVRAAGRRSDRASPRAPAAGARRRRR